MSEAAGKTAPTPGEDAAEEAVTARESDAPAQAAQAEDEVAQAAPSAEATGERQPDAGSATEPTVGDALSGESLRRAGAEPLAQELHTVMRIPVTLQVVLGQARMSIARLMKLGPGSVVPLDHRVGEPVDVVVNGRLVARGEVVLLEGESERFGITLTEIITPGSGEC